MLITHRREEVSGEAIHELEGEQAEGWECHPAVEAVEVVDVVLRVELHHCDQGDDDQQGSQHVHGGVDGLHQELVKLQPQKRHSKSWPSNTPTG